MNPEQDLAMAGTIAEKVAKVGGRAYFVGGFVRDRLMGHPCKDVDIEVHGISPDELRRILENCGELTQMGASFGIYGLRHYGIDIAMPRQEHATGKGHKDFSVSVDPWIGTRKAATRRDFTVNAMMMDVLTGEVLDPFGGRADLQRRVLRHVSCERFGEDPLRVLRAAQFAARLEFTVAPETIALCRGMDLSRLAKERVWQETMKALLQARKPSVYFETLREMEQLSFWFKEAERLIGTGQDPLFHPEGDVWTHTMRVLDEAARLREKAREPAALMLAALCHDFGKPEVSRVIEGRIRAFGHERAGLPAAEAFTRRLTDEKTVRRYVLNMTELHMRPGALCSQHAGEKAYMRLFDASVCPEDLLLLAQADRRGTGFGYDGEQDEALLSQKLEAYRMRMREEYVSPADLKKAGIVPGPVYTKALRYAHTLHLSGVPYKEALAQTLAFARRETRQEQFAGTGERSP